MTDDLIKRAEEALEGTTEGPWVVGNKFTVSSVYGANGEHVAGTHSSMRNYDRERQIAEQDANARFIAASRELVPELVARVKELEDQLKATLEREAETHRRHDARAEKAEAALAQAAAEERERCATIVESLPPAAFYPGGATHIAAAIREGKDA